MRLRMQKYPLKVVYKPGPQMFISDTLSRASLPLCRTQVDTPDYQIFQVHEEERFRQEVEETNLEEATFITDQRLEQICQETNMTNCRAPFVYVNTGLTWMNFPLKTA